MSFFSRHGVNRESIGKVTVTLRVKIHLSVMVVAVIDSIRALCRGKIGCCKETTAYTVRIQCKIWLISCLIIN